MVKTLTVNKFRGILFRYTMDTLFILRGMTFKPSLIICMFTPLSISHVYVVKCIRFEMNLFGMVEYERRVSEKVVDCYRGIFFIYYIIEVRLVFVLFFVISINKRIILGG